MYSVCALLLQLKVESGLIVDLKHLFAPIRISGHLKKSPLLTFSGWCPLKGHTYLDKLATESRSFVNYV